MLKRIQLECRGKKHEEIKELNLDNRRTTGEVEGLTDEFVGLEKLSMNGVGLTTLKGFPKLENLKKLELSDNRISGSLECLKCCPKLSHLNLSGNKIKLFDTLQPLFELKCLNTLDLYNCEVTTEDNYRERMFKLIPHLEYLDGFDRNDQEAVDSEDEDPDDEDTAEVEKELSDDDLNGEVDDDDDEEDISDVDGDTEDSNLVCTDSNQATVESEDDSLLPPVTGEEDSESEEEEEVGLDYLYKDDIQDDEDDDNDYNEEDIDEEDLDDEIVEEEHTRGVKRKREQEETSNQSSSAGDT